MSDTDQLNTAFAGRYTIERRIGEGGMATVYLARDVRHSRKVALKVLKPDLGAIVGPDRFLSEIQVTANLQHPNLLPLFDSGNIDSVLFYVMPYIEGESLRARLDRETQLPVDDAVHIAKSIASALDYAHRHGVIHRDLKPENILLHEGEPLVADFGIALAVRNAGGNRITQTGLSLGTPQYMSPEQATGDRTIDARSDIYSLGAITYEMLTGEPPHTGANAQAVIARLLTEQPRPVRTTRPNVSDQIEAAVERALEKLPADRWASAKEFSEALTGARAIVRSTRAAITSGAATADYSIVTVRRFQPREIAAWSIAAIAVAALGFLSLRPEESAPIAVASEFEVPMPDSLKPIRIGPAVGLTISRDGSTIAFVGARFGGGDVPALYVRRLEERDVQKISGSDSARAPVFSYKGGEIFFSQIRGGVGATIGRGVSAGTGGARGVGRGVANSSIRSIPLRGGSSRPVADSTDGNGHLSQSETGQMVFYGSGGLYLSDTDGNNARRIAVPDSTRRHIRYGFPDMLPGGKAALITISRGSLELDSAILGIVSIPGGKVTELGIAGTTARFSPDGGGHILYATADQQINAVAFSRRSLRVSGKPFAVVEGVRIGPGVAAAFTVSANGTLAWLGGDAIGSVRYLMIVSRDGSERRIETGGGMYAWPRISPDTQNVALAVGARPLPSITDPDIWILELRTRRLRRFTADSMSSAPFWSPDGERIVNHLRTGQGMRDTLVRVRSLYAGAPPEVLLHSNRRIGNFAYGPAHGYVTASYFPDALTADVWIGHSDSLPAMRPFLTEPYTEGQARVSPDNTLLAYVTNRTGRDEVYVRPILGGGAERRVSLDGGTSPVWSPGGRELFYRGAGYMMAAQVKGAGANITVSAHDTLFADVYSNMAGPAMYDVFPGGKELLMVRPERDAADTHRLFVLINWFARTRIE